MVVELTDYTTRVQILALFLYLSNEDNYSFCLTEML